MRGEESSDSESGRMEESSIRRSLETLCQELNMDEQTATEAMENFTAIWNTYTLEVNNVLWITSSVAVLVKLNYIINEIHLTLVVL